MANMIRLPAGLWQVSPRPYFQTGLLGLRRNLPWGHRNLINDNEHTHSVFQESGFEFGPNLGLGTFSRVVMAHWKAYRLNVAVKIYSKKSSGAEAALKLLPGEVEMLKVLKHPNIVGFYGAWETKFRVYLVMELLGNGNLLHYLLEKDCVGEEQGKTWFAQIMSAIKYCHDMEVAHRDIKCENILLDMNLNIRLSDFGFSSSKITWFADIPNSGWTKFSTFCGSLSYMAPEIRMKKPYSPLLADVWACGVVLFAILYGKFPFDSDQTEPDEMLHNFVLPNTPTISPECQAVFKEIFVEENRRVRSMDLLHADWIAEKIEEVYTGDHARLTLKEVNDANERERRRDPGFDYWNQRNSM